MPELLSAGEEVSLLEALRRVPLEPVVFRGVVARRTVAHFGRRYAYEGRSLREGDPLPAFLEPLRDRVAAEAGLQPASLEEVLLTRYPPGAGIGWHKDAPPFGPVIVGVSLAAPARLRLRRGPPRARETLDVELPPRSLYVLGGAARTEWEHSIPPVAAERFSLTFRTVLPKKGGR